MQDKLQTIVGAIVVLLGGTVAVVLLVAAFSIAQGWALYKLWFWFMVPLFGLPALSLAAAIGLVLVVRSVLYPPISSVTHGKYDWLNGFLIPLFLVLEGWVVHLFTR